MLYVGYQIDDDRVYAVRARMRVVEIIHRVNE